MKKSTTYHLPPTTYPKEGFTIIELLVFAAIFAIVMVAFITILVSVTRVQVRQTAAAEVNQQSEFLLQQIQYYVERSSLIELAQDTATTTLKLRMAAAAEDPTLIYVSSSVVYLQQATATAQALTSNKVNVTSLTFTKRSNAPSHDSVSVSFIVAYNGGLGQQFSQALNTSIARVNAATFDSNLVPSSTATYKIGASNQLWNSINDTIWFSGSNVGISASQITPGQTLEVNGGVRLNTSASLPTCSASQRGTFWVVESGAGVADIVEVCLQTSSGYAWHTF